MTLQTSDGHPIEFGFFSLPGLHMHAATAGPADSPLVILLHGFPQFWYAWRHQIKALAAAGFRVVAPDQRGYNLTDKTPPYDVGTLVGDVVSLIQACGRQQACIAGHDWGAGVAWALAAAHPERVSRLAILNVPHPAPLARVLRGASPRQMVRSAYIGFFQIPRLPEWLLSRNHFKLIRHSMIQTSRPSTFSAEDLDRYVEAWAQPGALSGGLGWYRAMWQAARPRTYRTYARRIRVPTLILWGQRDPALGKELAKESVKWLDVGRLVIFPEATHWVMEEAPSEVSGYLLEHFGPAGKDQALGGRQRC